jgi:hypothetical protein
MSVGDELRDPWGWLVAGISGGLGWAVLAAPLGPAAVVVGAGVGAAVLGTKVLVGAARRRESESDARPGVPDHLPRPPRGSIQATLLLRAKGAVARIGGLATAPGDTWMADELRKVLTDSRTVLNLVDELAGRVTLLDLTVAAAAPDALAREIEDLQRRMQHTADPVVRHEQQRALDALDSQADSVDRLLRGRDITLAKLQTAVVGLEGLAARSGELVALGPGSLDTGQAEQIVTDLTGSLDSVRAGIEEARAVLRDLG